MPHGDIDETNTYESVTEAAVAETQHKPEAQLGQHIQDVDASQEEGSTVIRHVKKPTTADDLTLHGAMTPNEHTSPPDTARTTANDLATADASITGDAAQWTRNDDDISDYDQMERVHVVTGVENMIAVQQERTDGNNENDHSQSFTNQHQNPSVITEQASVNHDVHAPQNFPVDEPRERPYIKEVSRHRRRDHVHHSPLAATPQPTHRVQKHRPGNPVPTNSSCSEAVVTPNTVSRKPSVEDLLLLLMRRARHQAATESQLVAEQNKLKEQYQTVSDELSTCREDLDASGIRERDHLARLQTANSNLTAFQTRFKKFKDWAQNVSQDMTLLRMRANKSHTAIEEAKGELQAVRRDTTVLESTQTTTLEDIGSVRTNIEEVRMKHEQSRQLLISSLSERANQVIVLSNANLQLQHTFLKERSVQKQADHETDALQRHTHKQLNRLEAAVSKLLEAHQATLKQSPGIESCLTMLTQLTEQQYLVPSDLIAFEKHLCAISEQ